MLLFHNCNNRDYIRMLVFFSTGFLLQTDIYLVYFDKLCVTAVLLLFVFFYALPMIIFFLYLYTISYLLRVVNLL